MPAVNSIIKPLKQFVGIWVLSMIPMLFLFCTELRGTDFFITGIDFSAKDLYYESGSGATPISIPNLRWSRPYRLNSVSELVILAEDNIPDAKDEKTVVGTVKLEDPNAVNLILCWQTYGDSQLSLCSVPLDLGETNSSVIVLHNGSERHIAIVLNESRISLQPNETDTLILKTNKLTEKECQIGMAFYDETNWELFYMTRWQAKPGIMRLLVALDKDDGTVQLQYYDVNLSAKVKTLHHLD